MGDISSAQIRRDMAGEQTAMAQDPSTGVTAWALGVCTVMSVDTSAHQIVLRPVMGTSDTKPFRPMPLVMPGAGKRHMLGAMPEVGDVCVVGWKPQGSSTYRKLPYIVGWITPSTWLAHQWATDQSFSPEEMDMSPKMRAQNEGIHHRTRNKMPEMAPGNIAASSSQGADILLNESVTISNRRANELILRDQDQALVTRSLQQFHHMAGTTISTGMVQRDATFLPRQLFSDGNNWAPASVANVQPEEDDEGAQIPGYMTPADALHQEPGENIPVSELNIPAHLDPYEFLQDGLFIDNDGFLLYSADITHSEAVYGGKPFFRVALQAGTNAAAHNVPAFTEHRLEISHTADGTLPVGVQTDGLDVDKMAEQPYLEVVYGTVVGNEAHTVEGRGTYGLPLRPVVSPSPALESAVGHPIGEQAATLVRLHPPASAGQTALPTWWALQKDGRFKFSIAGRLGASVAGATTGDIDLDVGGTSAITAAEGFHVSAPKGDKASNHGIELVSEGGAVSIYGGGSSTAGAAAARNSPEGDSAVPSVRIEGKRHVQVVAGGSLVLSGSSIILDSDAVSYKALGSMALQAGDALNLGGKLLSCVTSGQASYVHGGPQDGQASNGPSRTVQFAATPATGATGGVVDEYKVAYGGRSEEFTHGDHTTQMTVGNMQYTTAQGQWGAKAGSNTMNLKDTSGLHIKVPTGDATVETSGRATLSGNQNATVRSSSGIATVTGQGGVRLGAPGLPPGSYGIVNGSDLDPLTGAALHTYLMGSPGHRLTGHS